MGLAAEEHRREPDALAAERAAELQIEVAGLQLDPDASGGGARTGCQNVMAAVRNELPDLFDHSQGQRILAGPEADHHRFGVLAQQARIRCA